MAKSKTKTKTVAQNERSFLAMVFIELFAGFTGLDRLYAGQYFSGMFKLLIFITVAVAILLPNTNLNDNITGFRLLAIILLFYPLLIWTFIDALIVFVSVSRSVPPFGGNDKLKWPKEANNVARYISYAGMVIIPAYLVATIYFQNRQSA